MQYEIKALGIGGVLDHAVRLFKNHFGFLTKIALFLMLPVSLIREVLIAALRPMAEVGENPFVNLHIQLINLLLEVCDLLFVLIYGNITGAIICYGIAIHYTGGSISAMKAIRDVFRRIVPLVALSSFFAVLMLGGMFACIIPGIYLALIWFFVIEVFAIEQTSFRDAFNRSSILIKGIKGQALALMFLMTIFDLILESACGLLPGRYPPAIAMGIAHPFYGVFGWTISTVFYFSARCKAEHYDLELQTQDLERVCATEEVTL